LQTPTHQSPVSCTRLPPTSTRSLPLYSLCSLATFSSRHQHCALGFSCVLPMIYQQLLYVHQLQFWTFLLSLRRYLIYATILNLYDPTVLVSLILSRSTLTRRHHCQLLLMFRGIFSTHSLDSESIHGQIALPSLLLLPTQPIAPTSIDDYVRKVSTSIFLPSNPSRKRRLTQSLIILHSEQQKFNTSLMVNIRL
jgi:hypothetical protein